MREYLVDVITLGETMLRLSPPGCGRFEEAVTLDVRVGGSESNTAVALTRLGRKTAWCSRLPENPAGHRIENEIHRWGVDTSLVQWDSEAGARVGIYYVEYGPAPRGIEVHYDRIGSSFSRLTPEMLYLDLFSARLLHLTGITSALSKGCAACVDQLRIAARASGTPISFDVNYRARLWSPEEAAEGLAPVLQGAELVFCPQEDASRLFGISCGGTTAAVQLRERFEAGTVVITSGGEGAFAADSSGVFAVLPIPLGGVVDRLGAGDAFSAGVIDGWLEGNLQKGLEQGMAMAALKHTIPGDLLLATRAEIEAVMHSSGGSIRR